MSNATPVKPILIQRFGDSDVLILDREAFRKVIKFYLEHHPNERLFIREMPEGEGGNA